MADAQRLHDEIEEMIQHAGEIYHGLDANDDGTVSVAEVVNAWKGKQSHARSSGKSHQADLYQELMEHVQQVDKNHDGKISFVEFMRFYDNLKTKHAH